ncbi:MAG: Glycine betaine methyltransferase [Thermoanaerobaculia bacterium]|nr:Glycine betaine methyltransferase [Thermoanaerobaculia bacterium]
MEGLRPKLEMFTGEEADRVIDHALGVLSKVGFLVENGDAKALLREAGIEEKGARFHPPEAAVRQALGTVPARVCLFDRDGALAADLGGDRVHFDPGSAAIHILDPGTKRRRPPVTRDLCHLAWVTQACKNIAAQSTALVPSDVPESFGDRFRLHVALLNSKKPIVTGTFGTDAFDVMKRMLVAVRGSEKALTERPLAVFDCCPTAPLTWSELTCQALVDCARSAIPAELVSMPMGGATAPVTLREMVVQHCAESLSGVLIHQLACPGAPLIWGGSPAAFDMRHGTTPMGAIETMMVDLGNAQVGKRLGLPTHAYMGMSDAKVLDWQNGMESGIGAILAALSGINMISGPGMLDFETTQSLEKLVLDDQVCGMALRLSRGISLDSAGEAVELIRELTVLGNFLGHRHTRASFRREQFLPSRLVDRATHDDWEASGGADARDRAEGEVRGILARGNPAPPADDLGRDLDELIRAEARRLGIEALPEV